MMLATISLRMNGKEVFPDIKRRGDVLILRHRYGNSESAAASMRNNTRFLLCEWEDDAIEGSLINNLAYPYTDWIVDNEGSAPSPGCRSTTWLDIDAMPDAAKILDSTEYLPVKTWAEVKPFIRTGERVT